MSSPLKEHLLDGAPPATPTLLSTQLLDEQSPAAASGAPTTTTARRCYFSRGIFLMVGVGLCVGLLLALVLVPRLGSSFFGQSANGGGKICVFLHGSGVVDTHDGPLSTYPKYWGNVHKYVPQCDESVFIQTNTFDHSWDEDELQQKYCDLALYKQDSGETVIRNKVVFTHSMGGLVLGGAMKTGKCSFDTDTSSWYAVSAPSGGSKVCSAVMEQCGSPDATIIEWAAKFESMCKDGVVPAAYAHMAEEASGIDEVKQLLADYAENGIIKGMMCGTSPWGITSWASAGLEAVQKIAQLDQPNDGLVPLHKCALSPQLQSLFTNDPTSAYYHSPLNHADTTCRNGDSANALTDGSTMKPCTWFTNKV